MPEPRAQARALLAGAQRWLPDVSVVDLAARSHLNRQQAGTLIGGLMVQPQTGASTDRLDALALWCEHPRLSFEEYLLTAQAAWDGASPLWTVDRKLAYRATAQLVPNIA